MERIVRLPVSIRQAHIPEVGVDAQFYRDLSRMFEDISRQLLVAEGLLTVVAKKTGTTQPELREAIRKIAAQAGEKESAIDNLLAETEELTKSLVGTKK
jgi:hypothetical protein